MTFSEELTKVGVTLTPEEIKSVKTALATPVIAPGGVWPESPQKMVHRMALAHGLPEIPGYYGADLKTGEILKS